METSLSRSEKALAQADDALALADRALAARADEHAVAGLREAPVTVDAAPEGPPAPSRQPAQHLVHQVAVASARVGASAAAAAAPVTDGRVDTAELQRIWDLGEAARARTGRGRRVRTGAEVDALPDRPRNAAGHRHRARHRA